MLEIRLLGQYDVRRDGEPVKIASRPSRLLFAYLALTAGKHHPRERLAGLLWPESDESSARGNLRQALWRLRKAIGEAYLLVDNRTVAFDSAARYWLDAALLEPGNDPDLSEAVAVYEGELLPGYYEEWVLLERERLQAAFERKMQRLLDALEQQGRWPEILRWAEHWIAFGQVPEPAYRALMIAHAALGDLPAAAAAYERCAAALQLEVGVEPSTETRELYDQLLIGKELRSRSPSAEDDGAQKRAPRHNLPHQSTLFIGRERELPQVKELLLSGARFLTLVGPGGTGKTRLALQAASELVDAFKNGVFFVSLASIESPELIAQAIAETIGFPFSSDEDPQRQLLRHLRYRHYLLVLDSFEHLLRGASLVSEILHHAGQVKILATSREKLNLHEETIIRIEGLAYPPTHAAADALDFSAVKLFVEGARHSRPDFTAGADNILHIIHICRLLEGMPLGILLASAWVEMLAPEEIATEIMHSLDFLQAEWRDVPRRHLSVRAVFDPSWQRLTEGQRRLFARLAVFRGGFTREAAETVAGASLQDLASFVNKSLLRSDLETGRYAMHELLRQYAMEHLQPMPDIREDASQAHAVYFSDLIQQQWLKLISKEQLVALATIDAELENLRGSWRYWLKRRNAARIKMYIYSFWRVYDLRGWYNTGMELYREAAAAFRPLLETTDEADSTEAETEVVYAEALAQQAYFMTHLGYADEGLLQAQESVAILRRLRRFHELAIPLDILRYNAYYFEDLEKMANQNRHEVEFTNDHEGQWKRAFSSTWQTREAVRSGEYDQARQQIEESLQVFKQLGDNFAAIYPRIELGNMAVVQGSFAEAQKHYEDVLRVSQAAGIPYWSIVKTGRYLGNIAAILGDFQEARKYLLASLQFADELGMIRDVVSALYDIAAVEAAAGDRRAGTAKKAAVRWLVVVQQHPLSYQTRTFSVWTKEPKVRFRDLAEMLLAQLQEEMLPADYAAALVEGRTLELDTAVLELLADPAPSRP